MMKKRNLVIFMISLLVLLGGLTVYDNTHKKTDYQFNDFCNIAADTASKAEISNDKGIITVITDQEDVKRLVTCMKENTYKKVRKESYTDCRYSLAFYAGDEPIARVQFRGEDSCSIDGGDYKLQTSMIDELEQQIEKVAK